MVSFRKRFMKHPIKLKETQQLFFLKRLERLLNNGYSLVNALEVIKWDKQLEPTSDIIINELTKGIHVDEAFKLAGFHSNIVSYLYFVRINGNINESIIKCIQMFEHRIKNISKFKQVIRYPVVLFSFFLILLIFLKVSVLPSFMEIFQISSASTKSVMLSINIINIMSTLFIGLLCIVLFTMAFWKVTKNNFSIDKRIQFYNKIPIFRSIVRVQTTYYFSTHMGMFLKTGMSMKDVIFHMTKQKELPLIAYYAELMMQELKRGFYVNHLLEQLPFIENQVTSIFQNNTNISDLQMDLTAYADYLAEMMEQQIMRIITLIQPLFFVVLACLIIFTYLTLMWPMFQLINSI